MLPQFVAFLHQKASNDTSFKKRTEKNVSSKYRIKK